MLLDLRILFLALLTCLASAFSTRFLIEGGNKEGKIQVAKENKTLNETRNNTIREEEKNQKLEVEIVPLSLDMFTLRKEIHNMTPLKLVTAIATQHLITAVKNISATGNSFNDTLNMLEGIVSEFNQTAQIIKLTAKYVNISGQYIMGILKKFEKQRCHTKSLDESIKSIRENFLRSITTHAEVAVKELFEKTKENEVTGHDILISSSYHIVVAFQEMTNQVLNLTEVTNNNCETLLHDFSTQRGGEKKYSEQETENIFSFQPIPQQGKEHKSIKKAQANINIDNILTETMSDKNIAEEMSHQAIRPDHSAHQQVKSKPTEDLTVEYIPLKEISSFDAFKKGIQSESLKEKENQIKVSLVGQHKMFGGQVQQNFNSKDLSFILPENVQQNNKQITNNKQHENDLKADEDVSAKYIPLRQVQIYQTSENINQQDNQHADMINRYRNDEDSTRKQSNNQDVVSLSAHSSNENTFLLSNQRDTLKQIKPPNNLIINLIPTDKLPKSNSKIILIPETNRKDNYKKYISANKYEKDSSPVDSLKNVPWSSPDRLNQESNIFNTAQIQQGNQEEVENQCDDHLEPVCGYDDKSGKFIVFLNPCKQDIHNKIHQTGYTTSKMDTCVRLYLQSPSLWSHPFDTNNALHRNLNLRPR